MKILMMSEDTLIDGTSGNTVHLISLFKHLSEYVDVCLLAPYKNKKEISGKKVIGIPVSLIRIICPVPIAKTICYEIILTLYIIFAVLSYSPTVLYVRMSPFFFSPFVVSRVFRIPLIVEVNGIFVDELKFSKNNFKKKIASQIIPIIERIIYNHAEVVITVTPHIKKYIVSNYNVNPQKIFVISNGTDTETFKPLDKASCRKKLKLDINSYYVCFVGNLTHWQGLEYLILAIPKILSIIPNVKFLIIGDGPLRDSLKKLAMDLGVASYVLFTGAVPHDTVPEYINSSDVCVVYKRPIKSGYSPLKLYEYMACGKPVIASNVKGFEIVKKQKAGLLIEPENPSELAKGIIRILMSKQLWEAMGRRGRAYAVEHSWDKIAMKTIQIIRQHQKVIKNDPQES